MSKELCNYRLRASLGYIELPEGVTEIIFSDFTIRECPNRAQPEPLRDDDGDVIDVDWVYPEKPDRKFPVCDYYLETNFEAEEGHGWSQAEWLLAWCLTRLRLFKGGRLWGTIYQVHDEAKPGILTGVEDISQSLRRRPSQPPSSGWGFIESRRHVYQIKKEEMGPLRESVDRLAKRSGKDFDLAIRRFHQSFDRDLPQDVVVDLFIALEALLSNDSEAIGYKIALRASQLIGQRPQDKTGINSFLKEGYKERSGIVHGKQSSIKWSVKNCDRLDALVRTVLRILLEKACDGTVLKPEHMDQFLFFSS